MTVEEKKCPVCDTLVRAEESECPSCGLPRELWPDEVEAPVTETGPVAGAEPEDEAAPVPRAETPVAVSTVQESEETSPPGQLAAHDKPTEAEAPTPEGGMMPVKEEAPGEERMLPPEVRQREEPIPSTEGSLTAAQRFAEEPAARRGAVAGPRSSEDEARATPKYAAGRWEERPQVPKERHRARPKLSSDPDKAFSEIFSSTKWLINIALKHSLDIRSATSQLKSATNAWRLGEKESALEIMTLANEQILDSIGSRCKPLLAEMEIKVRNYGPFASEESQEILARLRGYAADENVTEFFSAYQQLTLELEGKEKELGGVGQLIATLNTYATGIDALGGQPVQIGPYVEKAFVYVESHQRKEAEAVLAIAMGSVIDSLTPLIASRISTISLRLKKDHDKGRDVKGAAILVKQVTVSLHSRRYAQVLQLLQKIESLLFEQGRSHGSEDQPSRKPQIRSRSTIVSTVAEDTPSFSPARSAGFEVKKGRSYLFFEAHMDEGIAAFVEAKGKGKGLLVTTTFPPKIIEEHSLEGVDMVWISESSGWKETYHPKMLDHELSGRVLNFLRSGDAGALALDGLGYLVSSNGLERVEKFLKKIMDTASSSGVTIIATLAPGGMDNKQSSMLKGLFDYVQGD